MRRTAAIGLAGIPAHPEPITKGSGTLTRSKEQAKFDILRVLVFVIASAVASSLLLSYAEGWRATAELSMYPTLAKRSFVLIDFHRLPQVGEMAVFKRPAKAGEKSENSVKRVAHENGAYYWMRADNFGVTGEDSDHYGWVPAASIVGTVVNVDDLQRRANLKRPAGGLWNRLVLKHSPKNLKESPTLPAVAVIDGSVLSLHLPDRVIPISRSLSTGSCEWKDAFLVFRDSAGEAWYSSEQARVVRRLSYPELARIKRVQDEEAAKQGVRELSKKLRMRGEYVKTAQKELCDGRLDTFVLMYPDQTIKLPKPKSGELSVAAFDTNHLSQLCSAKARKSLSTGWTEFKARGVTEFIFTISKEERLLSSAPIAVMEVRQ